MQVLWGRIPQKCCVLGLLWWVFPMLSVPLERSAPNAVSWSLGSWLQPPSPRRDGRSTQAPVLQAALHILLALGKCLSVISYWVPLGFCSGNTKIRKSDLDEFLYSYRPILQPVPKAGEQRGRWGSLGGGGAQCGGEFVRHPLPASLPPPPLPLRPRLEPSCKDSQIHGTISVPRIFTVPQAKINT